MRKLFVSIFFLITTLLYTNPIAVTENDPNSIVEGVSVITGDFYTECEDIIIQGYEPLRLRRSYLSQKGEGSWTFLPYENAILYTTTEQGEGRLHIPERSGATLIYKWTGRGYSEFTFSDSETNKNGMTNTARGPISARTNLKNQRITLSTYTNVLTVYAPDNSQRIYRSTGWVHEISARTFELKEEILANGNRIIYEKPNRDDGTFRIRTCDPDDKVTYAWVKFYPKKREKHRSKNDYGVETSDGRHFEFKFFDDYYHGYLLRQVEPDENPTETIHYFDYEGKKLVNAFTWPKGRALHISYYQKGKNHNPDCNLDKDDDRCLRVRDISAPVGESAHNYRTHQFVYDLKHRKTTVFDAYNVPTEYHWSRELHLKKIDKFSAVGKLYNRTKFIWGKNGSKEEGHLLCKILFDEFLKPIQAIKYSYDPFGNIQKEELYGNLSGDQDQAILELDSEGFPTSSECYTKRYCYTQDGRHLIERQEEDSGLAVEYSYYKNTPLVSEERSFDRGTLIQKKTYRYNSRRILKEEIVEDVQKGSFLSKKITPLKNGCYVGMPHIIEERIHDSQGDKLLKKTLLHYGTGGRVTKKEIYNTENKFCYSYEYKYERGKVVQETDPYGHTDLTTYDLLGNKVSYKAIGYETTFLAKYDLANRPIRCKETGFDLERTYFYSYNLLNQKIKSTDEYGFTTRFVYDSLGHLLETHLPLEDGKTALIIDEYDAAGNIKTHTDAEANTTLTTYTIRGKPICIEYPDGSQEHFRYYLNGTLKWHKDQDGVELDYTYDSLGRMLTKTHRLSASLLEQYSYDAQNIISKTDAEGRTTTYQYDGAGRLISEQLGDEIISYEYDTLGRQNRVLAGQSVTVIERDYLDQIIEERKEDLDGTIFEKVSFEYSPMRDRIGIIKEIQGISYKENFIYDAFHRLVQKTDALENTTYYLYTNGINQKITIDPLSLQVVEKFNPQNQIALIEKKSPHKGLISQESFSYDSAGNLMVKTNSWHNFSQTISYQYNSLYQLESVTEGSGTSDEKTTRHTYSPKGLILETVKPSGILLSHSYDMFSHPSSLSSSDGSIAYTLTHDKTGRLLSSVDLLTNQVLIRSYDLQGRLTEETLPNGLTLVHRYDAQGRRTNLDLPDKSCIHYTWDPFHIKKVSRYDAEGSLLYSHIFDVRDRSGNTLKETLPFNLGIALSSYDPLARRVEIRSSYFSQNSCLFDKAGNLKQTVRQGIRLCYDYDELYQLVLENDHTYDYDPLYNRTGKDGQAFAINSLNQTSELIYDSDGNPEFYEQKKLTYDALDRLIAVQEGSKITTYSYDYLSRRISKNDSTSNIYYLYDDQNEIGAYDSVLLPLELRILAKTSQAEIGAAIALEIQGRIYIPFHDLQGNVSALYSVEENAVENYQYTAFGEELFSSPTSPWRFSSKRTDTETGFVYYGRRYYCPKIGRWLTKDPLREEAGVNFYAFVSNSPLTHLDLYGLIEEALSHPEKSEPQHFNQPVKQFFIKNLCKSHIYAIDYEPNNPDVRPKTVLFINGICTSYPEAENHAKSLINYNKDIKIHGVYNATHSIAVDSMDCVLNMIGIETRPVTLVREFCKDFHENNPPDVYMLIIAHSEGGLLLRNSLAPLERNVQERCFVTTIASAQVVPRAMCADSHNYISTHDVVPHLRLLNPIQNYAKTLESMKEMIILPRHQDAPFFDHAFTSPTYTRALNRDINDFVKNNTFTQGGAR